MKGAGLMQRSDKCIDIFVAFFWRFLDCFQRGFPNIIFKMLIESAWVCWLLGASVQKMAGLTLVPLGYSLKIR